MLIGFSIVVLAMVGCSSTDETLYPPDIVEPIGSIPEATIADNDGGDISSQGEIVTSVLKPGSAGESIETTTTEEEVLADLIDFTRVYQNLGIKKITDIVDPVDGVPRLYIATQDGIIYSLDRDETSPNPNTFLDLRDLVSTQYNEEGLLGVAFDPEFGTSRELRILYSSIASQICHR